MMLLGSFNNVFIKLYWFDGQIILFEQWVLIFLLDLKKNFIYVIQILVVDIVQYLWFVNLMNLVVMDLVYLEKKNLLREKNSLISLMDIERMVNQGS